MSWSLHHRYSLCNDACAYCGVRMDRLASEYCIPFEEAVDLIVDWAKADLEKDCENAIRQLRFTGRNIERKLGLSAQ